jgi:glycosyltransferase involved in cell wall biosynthesis
VSVPSLLRIGYLISRYPAISHTFILREILALKSHHIEIEPASINPPDRPSKALTSDERAEYERTYYVKKTTFWQIFADFVAIFFRSPIRVTRALFFGLRLSRMDLRAAIYNCFYWIEAVLLARWMRRKSIQHLHVHFATPAATVALLLKQLAPVTFSLTVHGPDEFYDVSGYFLAEKIAEARFICAISQYARSQLMKTSSPEHWGKIEVVPLGIYPEQFPPRPFRPAPERFEILCVGRLVSAKGQHILLRAASLLHQNGKSLLLRFVGDGPDRASLEQESRRLGLTGCVRFEGAVNQDHIRQFYETADIFALASFAEGVPVVLMEAMAMEIPCVATWIAGIPELIRNEIDGLLVPPSSAEEMAGAISRLMQDEQLRLRLGRAGRARVLDRYHLEKNSDRLAEVFYRRLGEQMA